MRYTVRILANAERDLVGVETYYNKQAPHETKRCLDTIEKTLDWIAEYAHQPPVSRFGLRRVSTEPFRYIVWYRLFDEERFVQVVAVLHQRRGNDALAERAR